MIVLQYILFDDQVGKYQLISKFMAIFYKPSSIKSHFDSAAKKRYIARPCKKEILTVQPSISWGYIDSKVLIFNKHIFKLSTFSFHEILLDQRYVKFRYPST